MRDASVRSTAQQILFHGVMWHLPLRAHSTVARGARTRS
jgi:hypothetical protein